MAGVRHDKGGKVEKVGGKEINGKVRERFREGAGRYGKMGERFREQAGTYGEVG